MILYQALSAYQILECMVHRQIYYRDRKCVLILGDYIKERMPRYFELETKRFFNEVYLFRFGGYRGTEEEIIRQVGEELARSIPYRPQDFEKILIAGIHTYLQVYFLSEGISFEMFEDGSGALSRPRVLAEIHRKSGPGRYALIEKYGLYDHTSPLITKKYCDMAAQEPGFSDPRAEDFQVMEEFRRLPGRQQEEIRRMFQVPRLSGREDEVLLLTQQFASLGQLTFDGQIDIYRHLFDYYLEGRRVRIKPHPDDILYYSLLFPEAELIEGTFPSELLPLAFDRLPGTVCTVSSTGVNQIRRFFDRQILFNPAYEESYQYDALYCMALCLALHLGMEGILTEGVNLAQLRNMARCMGEPWDALDIREYREGEYRKKECREGECREAEACALLLLRGDEGSRELPGERPPGEETDPWAVLWLNEKGRYRMYDPGSRERFFQLQPIVIREGEARHTMYFYSERSEVNRMAEEFSEERELPHQGKTLSVEGMTEEELRICMLEGILAATERRLLEYIETEKELREEIRSLKEAGDRRGGRTE